MTPAPRRIAQAAEAALDVLLRAALEPAAGDELAAARAALESDVGRAGEGALARARRLGFATAITGDADDARHYLDAVRSVGPTELRAIATRILNVDHLTLAVALADGATARDETVAALTPRLEAMVVAAPALAEKHATAVAPAVGSGEAVRFVTPAGVRVLVLSDGSAPLVSVQASWIDRSEGLGSAGDDAAPVIATMLERGTRTRSAADIAAEIQAIGGVLKGFAAPGTLGLRADFLPQHLGRGLALLADCAGAPGVRGAGARRRRSGAAGAGTRRRARRRRDGAGGAAAVRRDVVAGNRAARRRRRPVDPRPLRAAGSLPPPLPAVAPGRRRRGQRRSRRRRRTAHQRFPRFASASPAPASASPVPAVRGEGQGEGRPAAAPAPPPPAPGQADVRPTTVFRAKSGHESSAVIGYPTFAPGDPNRPAMDVLAELLAGEGGRLAAALADERTLGCRAGARVAPAAAAGWLAITLTCPPARLDAGVSAARAALARLVPAGVTPDEVTQAARRLVGTRAAALRTRMAVADALVRDEGWGLPMLAYRRAPAAFTRVTAADVARAAQAALDPKREIIAVVHPPSATPALARTSSGSPGRAEAGR